MTINEYREKFNSILTSADADAMLNSITSDSNLTANEVGTLLGELFRSEAISKIGDQMKADWIAKGMTKEEVNAKACRK